MKTLLLLALLTVVPTISDTVTRMAGIVAVTPKGELTTERQEKVKLAGVTVTNPSAVHKFLKQFLLNKVAKLDWEPGKTGLAHVFVAVDCKEIAKLLKEPLPTSEGACVRSVYVNEILLKKRWAKPMPKGVTLYREKLFAQTPAKAGQRKKK